MSCRVDAVMQNRTFPLAVIFRFALLCGWMACGMFLVSRADVHAADDTLNNPGFESPYTVITPAPDCPNIAGSVAEGWEDNTCWVGAGAHVVYAQDAGEFHGGASSQQVQFTAGRWQIVQWLPLSAGTVYTAGIWLRSTAPMQVMLLLRQANEPYNAYVSRTIHVTSAWTRYTVTGRTESVDGVLLIGGTDPGTLWMDDAELTTTPAPPDSLPTLPVTRSFFGMHYHRVDTPFPRVDGVIGGIRFWDAEECQWAEVNSSRGVYDWTGLDARVNAALANKVEIVMNLGRTPRWASARPDESSPYGPGQAAEPADDAYWREWVTAIGTRYQGKIKYWEIWNEPNETDFYSGSVVKLVDLARQAHEILKGIDATNQLVTPSAVADTGWLADYLARGGGAYADIIGYHMYLSPGDDEPEMLYSTIIPNVRMVLDVYGQGAKPLWDTEAGWLARAGKPLLPNETAVGYVGRRHVLEWARGIGRMEFYAWDNHGVMSVEPTLADNVTLTDAGVAYREIARWLTGSTMTKLTVDADGTWIVELQQASGAQTYVVWNPDHTSAAPLHFKIPAGWNVFSRRDLYGSTSALRPGSVANDAQAGTLIDGRPILLEPAKQFFIPLVQYRAHQSFLRQRQ